MRATVLIVTLLASAPCFAMGGGGGMGMQGGGYGGSYHSGPARSPGFDDYHRAVRLIEQAKYAESLPYLNRALAARPGSADVLNYLGYTHRMLGDYPGSLDFYTRALARDPDHKGAHEYLGELYLKMNQLANARGQLAELTRLCPNGCDEKNALTKAIADYELAAAAPATPAAAVPAAASAAAAPPSLATPAAAGTTPGGTP
jgi:tetratricopeptide (TPR) repeat protein